jgi:hypothetical protein
MSTEADNVDTSAEVAGTQVDKINTGALGTLVAVGLFAMISITAAVTALVRHDIEVEEAEKDGRANQVVIELKASQRGMLNGPAGYVDRGKGKVTLPIDLAKGLVVGELEKDPSSATPPAPPGADAGIVEVTGAAVDGGATPATLASGGAPGASGQAPSAGAATKLDKKPEQGRDVKLPTPANSNKPTPVPTPTPTAATPGALSPGPTNK